VNFSRSSLDANENRCVESMMIGVLKLAYTPAEDTGRHGRAANGRGDT
jgi:hypothetical protein